MKTLKLKKDVVEQLTSNDANHVKGGTLLSASCIHTQCGTCQTCEPCYEGDKPLNTLIILSIAPTECIIQTEKCNSSLNTTC